MSDATTCPQRGSNLGPWKYEQGLDTWVTRGDLRACSFCGSLHPDEFMARVVAGEHVVPTDKSYKAYIGLDHHKFYFEHLSQPQRQQFLDLLKAGRMLLAIPGYFYVTPFFIQLHPMPEAP